MNLSSKNFLSFILLLLTFSSVNQTLTYHIGNTVIWWTVNAVILYFLFNSRNKYFNPADKKFTQPLFIYLLWNIFCIARGVFIAENYWEWKNLVGTAMVLLLPLTIYISSNKNVIQTILGKWFIYALPAFFLFLPFFNTVDGPGKYLIPITMLLLFFPVLPIKWKIILLFFTLIVIIGNLDARSNVIKFSISFIFGLLLYLKTTWITKITKAGRVIFLILPFVFFMLGISGNFNIFNMEDYLEGDFTSKVVQDGEVKEANLKVDTRTFLYKEVISSAIKHDYYIIGRSPARGNESESFGLYALEELETGKMERFGNEVSILNVFTWTGLIGVVLYFLIFFKATYLAIYKSNNSFIKIVGMFVAFRWTYAWVEDFSNFDLSYFFLWIMIGICFSNSFRDLSDFGMKFWILGIFDKRYQRMSLMEEEQTLKIT